MTTKQITKMLAAVKANWPRQHVSDEMISLWLGMLGDLVADAAERALKEHMAVSEWPPTVADIRRRATRIDLVGPLRAWSQVENLIRGNRGSIDDPLVLEVFQLLVPNRSAVLEQDMPFLRAQFIKAYTEATERAQEHANVSSLSSAPRVGQLSSRDAMSAIVPGGTES